MGMNKYVRRGVLGVAAGGALCVLGLFLMKKDLSIYKWALVSGVIGFGVGFLTTIYGLIRKIERRSILDDRKERKQHDE